MTAEQAKGLYHGATLNTSGTEWTLSFEGVETSAQALGYRLCCRLVAGDQSIENVEIVVKTPETWPAKRVLKGLQDALAGGWKPKDGALVLTDLP